MRRYKSTLLVSVVWWSVVWCGVVWWSVVWCGGVWCGVVWCGGVWCGVVECGVVWCGGVWCGVLCCAEVWWSVVWCGVQEVAAVRVGTYEPEVEELLGAPGCLRGSCISMWDSILRTPAAQGREGVDGREGEVRSVC